MIEVFRGTPSTLDTVADLWLDMVKEGRPEWTPNVDVWKHMALSYMASGIYTQLIACDNNVPVGFGDFMLFLEPSTGKMHSLGQHFYVKPKYRKGFTGFKLYKEWKTISKELNCQVIELFSFTDEIDRWTKVGFNPVRTLMRKEI